MSRSTTETSRPSKRRLFRFGPGLLLAILASVAVWAFLPREPDRPKVQPSPLPQGAVVGAPDPHWLLQQKDALGLSSVQAQRLTALVARWDRETRNLNEALQAEAAAFEKGMADRSGKQTNVQTMKQEAEPVSALSRQLSDARKAWWDDAGRVLAPEQRSRAETAWGAHWTAPGTNRGRK